MFTSRGYRRSKKENKYKSRQGQIIQQKPVFTIDNNPYVLEQYRKFLMGSTTTPTPTPPTPSEPTFDSDTHNITLSEFILSWTQTTDLDAIYSQLLQFAVNIFAQYTTDGKYPISLELYSPDLDDTNAWVLLSQTWNINSKHTVVFKSIIIDRLGNLSFTQNLDSFLYTSSSGDSLNKTGMTIGFNHFSSPASGSPFGSPSTMKMSVNYFTL